MASDVQQRKGISANSDWMENTNVSQVIFFPIDKLGSDDNTDKTEVMKQHKVLFQEK